MRYEKKHMTRRSDDVFFSKQHKVDMSQFTVLNSSIDTFKYLIDCKLRPDVIQNITDHYSNRPDNIIILNNIEFYIIRSSKDSGYQFILNNQEIGITVLLKSFYVPLEDLGSHIKIECSPHFILESRRSNGQYSDELDFKIAEITNIFATDIHFNYPSAHFCVDFQGFDIPLDLPANMATKSKRVYQNNGLSTLDMTNSMTIHNNGDTFTFGEPSSLQCSIYRKDKEVLVSGKKEFFYNLYSQLPLNVEGGFYPDKSITRVEMRIHQSVVRQFCNGTLDNDGNKIEITCRDQFLKHINKLWLYCLNSFRYQYSTSYIHPLWTLLENDVSFHHFEYDYDYKRSYKKEPEGFKKNIALWLGNLISIKARRSPKTTPEDILECIHASGMSELFYWYHDQLSRSDNENDYLINDYLQKKLDKYRLAGHSV